MNCQKVTNHIVQWLSDYRNEANMNGFIIGISGGIDSAVVSTLCAMTGKKTVVVRLPTKPIEPDELSAIHAYWLRNTYDCAEPKIIYLETVFNAFKGVLPINQVQNKLAMANLQSRLRMCALYNFAADEKLLVVGTGNYVEDYGVGFFTKYGDGGVDISPIGKLTKTEVRELAKWMNIDKRIIEVTPTDGLWEDGRSDEDHIGASYEELEWAMNFNEHKNFMTIQDYNHLVADLDDRSKEVLDIYSKFHTSNSHKMNMPPICEIPENTK